MLIVCAATILFYVFTGYRPATGRATIMVCIALMLQATMGARIRRASGSGLAAAAFILLCLRPSLLFDAGFQLSFVAVLALLILMPPIKRTLDKTGRRGAVLWSLWLLGVVTLVSLRLPLLWRPGPAVLLVLSIWLVRYAARKMERPAGTRPYSPRLSRRIRALCAAQLAVQAGMVLPLSCLYFGAYAVSGLFTNMLAIPLAAVLVPLGLCTALLGCLPGIGHPLALLPAALTNIVGRLFLQIAWWGDRWFPHPRAPDVSLVQIAVYYLLLGLCFVPAPAFAAVRRFLLLKGGTGCRP